MIESRGAIMAQTSIPSGGRRGFRAVTSFDTQENDEARRAFCVDTRICRHGAIGTGLGASKHKNLYHRHQLHHRSCAGCVSEEGKHCNQSPPASPVRTRPMQQVQAYPRNWEQWGCLMDRILLREFSKSAGPASLTAKFKDYYIRSTNPEMKARAYQLQQAGRLHPREDDLDGGSGGTRYSGTLTYWQTGATLIFNHWLVWAMRFSAKTQGHDDIVMPSSHEIRCRPPRTSTRCPLDLSSCAGYPLSSLSVNHVPQCTPKPPKLPKSSPTSRLHTLVPPMVPVRGW